MSVSGLADEMIRARAQARGVSVQDDMGGKLLAREALASTRATLQTAARHP